MFTVITPSTHDIGAFDVRRTLPNKERTMVGPFIFVDQFGPAHFDIGQGMDVRPHPHINLATVTYLFEGAIDHRDSLGTWATIRPGACNLMTAGRGIVHSERTPAAERATGSPISGMLPIEAEADERAVLVAMGDATLDGEALDRYSLYILKPGQAMTLRAATDARVMLLGGEAFRTPRHLWWNFVSSSRDRINQAKHDWKDGNFPLVAGDSEEFIPLPDAPKTPGYP